MAEEKTYNGWSNRETWAVYLHWSNNEGDYNHFLEVAKKYHDEEKRIREFADYLEERAEEIQQSVMDEEATKEAKMFMIDVGSLWRVDWMEIAVAFWEEI